MSGVGRRVGVRTQGRAILCTNAPSRGLHATPSSYSDCGSAARTSSAGSGEVCLSVESSSVTEAVPQVTCTGEEVFLSIIMSARLRAAAHHGQSGRAEKGGDPALAYPTDSCRAVVTMQLSARTPVPPARRLSQLTWQNVESRSARPALSPTLPPPPSLQHPQHVTHTHLRHWSSWTYWTAPYPALPGRANCGAHLHRRPHPSRCRSRRED